MRSANPFAMMNDPTKEVAKITTGPSKVMAKKAQAAPAPIRIAQNNTGLEIPAILVAMSPRVTPSHPPISPTPSFLCCLAIFPRKLPMHQQTIRTMRLAIRPETILEKIPQRMNVQPIEVVRKMMELRAAEPENAM